MNLGKIYHRNLNVTIEKTAKKNQELSKSQAFDKIIKGAADFFKEDKTGKDFVVQCLELRGGTLTPNEDNPYENLIYQLGKNKNNYWFTGAEVFPRGFQKTLAIGYIRDNANNPANMAFINKNFNFNGFKEWIDQNFGSEYPGIADYLNEKYYAHIKIDNDLKVKFGNTEYTNEVNLIRLIGFNAQDIKLRLEEASKDIVRLYNEGEIGSLVKYNLTDCNVLSDIGRDLERLSSFRNDQGSEILNSFGKLNQKNATWGDIARVCLAFQGCIPQYCYISINFLTAQEVDEHKMVQIIGQPISRDIGLIESDQNGKGTATLEISFTLVVGNDKKPVGKVTFKGEYDIIYKDGGVSIKLISHVIKDYQHYHN